MKSKGPLCSKCGLHDRQGTSAWCRPCKLEYNNKRSVEAGCVLKRRRNPEHLTQGLKECYKCDRLLVIKDDFSPCARGVGQVAAYCRRCITDTRKATVSKEDRAKQVREYRSRNLEHWRALHRAHQFNRRAVIKVSTEIPAQFMKELYEQKICTYCGKFTPVGKRTADHVVPLNKQGEHSTTNLVMACLSCNSSKSNRPLNAFLKELYANNNQVRATASLC